MWKIAVEIIVEHFFEYNMLYNTIVHGDIR